MKYYPTQPLDLMQFINTKYHEPFIQELLEFDGDLDTEKFTQSIDRLAKVFPLLKYWIQLSERLNPFYKINKRLFRVLRSSLF